MTSALKKELARDTDGLLTYEYLANHIDDCDRDLPGLVDNMIAVDSTGQFIVSAARYLAAIDLERYRRHIDRLVATAIERDHERRYIADLLPAIWGADYGARAAELSASDNNFRRIYRRVTPAASI